MKTQKTIRIALAVLIGLSCVSFALSTAFAASYVTVSVSGDYAQITFPESGNLFEDLQNLMPGDSRVQEIVIQNNTGGPMRVLLKANAESANEETVNFLNELTMELWISGGEAPIARETFGAPVTDFLILGDVDANETITLQLKLNVPNTLDNSYAGKTYVVPWVFQVVDLTPTTNYVTPGVVTSTVLPTPVPTEEFEPEDIPTDIFEDEDIPVAPPLTGEAMPSVLMAVALCVAGLALAAAVAKKARKA